jgi:hypothetical protein
MTVKVLLIVNPAKAVIPAKAGIQIFLFANRYLFLVVENNLHMGLLNRRQRAPDYGAVFTFAAALLYANNIPLLPEPEMVFPFQRGDD